MKLKKANEYKALKITGLCNFLHSSKIFPSMSSVIMVGLIGVNGLLISEL